MVSIQAGHPIEFLFVIVFLTRHLIRTRSGCLSDVTPFPEGEFHEFRFADQLAEEVHPLTH